LDNAAGEIVAVSPLVVVPAVPVTPGEVLVVLVPDPVLIEPLSGTIGAPPPGLSHLGPAELGENANSGRS
jgi:hypothetical protein